MSFTEVFRIAIFRQATSVLQARMDEETMAYEDVQHGPLGMVNVG
jgi:hypothetical protein